MSAGPQASKILHFVSLTDSFIMLDTKLLRLLSCMKTRTALQVSLIGGTFEKQVPGNVYMIQNCFTLLFVIHLDKVDQSDYKKITIHFEEVGFSQSVSS